MAKKNDSVAIDIPALKKDHMTFAVIGTTPIILARMSEKARHELLLPRGRKTAADKATSLKHNPLEEYQASPYTDKEENGPTYLQVLAASFKKAMSGAALDLPGASKSQIGRLLWVEGATSVERVALYGVPQMFMSVTRSADMNKTPDIRTRAIVPKWACYVTVNFVRTLIKEPAVVNLLASAGITQGIGDWRPQKGSGTYGSFEIADKESPEFQHIIKTGGREVQLSAMASPSFYDDETEEMYAWFAKESTSRGFSTAPSNGSSKRKEERA